MMPDSPEVGARHGEVLQKVDDGATTDADGLHCEKLAKKICRTLMTLNIPFVHLLLKDVRALSVYMSR